MAKATENKAMVKLENLYGTYKAAGVLEKASIFRQMKEAAEAAEIALAEFLKSKAPKEMAEAHKAAKSESRGGFGTPQAHSRRGFIVRAVFENVWDSASLAEAISENVPGYKEGEIRMYRGREVVVTRKKNIAAISGTLQDLRSDGNTVKICPDGRISCTRPTRK